MLSLIQSLVKNDLNATDQYIISQLESKIPLIRQIIEYVLKCGGKRIRPMVLLLSSRALAAEINKHVDLAAVIELIHTATLLHDDVVDSSTLRRGHQTAHTIWGSEASVLVGDFLYSRAFQIIVEMGNSQILNIFAKATHYMAEGEILQLVNCHNPDTTEEFYFDIINRKTAKLFEIASQLGAMIATNDEGHINAFKDYGFHLGMAYQLIDDALDYSQPAEKTGKHLGQDLADGKMTLPLIYAMTKSKSRDLAILKDAIKNGSCDNLGKILSIIESTNAISYTSQAAKKHATKAQDALKDIHPSPFRKGLEDLSQFVVERSF